MPDLLVMAANPTDATVAPLWSLILIGMLSGVIGAVIGPIVQRTFSRSDRALDARQSWAKEKLQTVFGIGDERYPSDGPQPPFFRLVPPCTGMAHHYDMHTINSAVEESTDLMMLQPRRSAWAREWLMQWHFRLQPEASLLHQWRHYNEQRWTWDAGQVIDTEATGHPNSQSEIQAARIEAERMYELADRAYMRRVRRVQSSLAIWATGQWLTHPSWVHWIANRQWVQRIWPKPLASRTAPQKLRDYSVHVNCDCMERAFEALRVYSENPMTEPPANEANVAETGPQS